MAKEKRITVDVSPDGDVVIKTEGYQGAECLKATQKLEESLGVVTERKKTAEFKLTATQTNVTKQSQKR